MSDFEQIPFGAAEFADNPEPRCPCLLLLDTSVSMRGHLKAAGFPPSVHGAFTLGGSIRG